MRDSALKLVVEEMSERDPLGVGEELMRDSALKHDGCLDQVVLDRPSEKSSCATAL